MIDLFASLVGGRKGSIPSNIVWSPLVPMKVGFFALKVTSGKDSELD